MHQHLNHFIAVALAGLCSATHADSLRFDLTEEGVERGDCELEWAAERLRADGPAKEHSRSLTLRCGIGWQTELGAGFERVEDGDGHQDRWSLEGRRLLHAGDGLRWAMLAGASTRREGDAGAWRWDKTWIKLEASLRLAAGWQLEASLGTERERLDRRSSTPWQLAVERAVGESWAWGAALEGDDREPARVAGALRWQPGPEGLALTLGVGRQLGAPRERSAELGIAFEF